MKNFNKKTSTSHLFTRLPDYQITKSGFTLIEILVVMVIIGILATIGIGSFRSAQMKSRDAKRKADLRHVSEALEAFYNDEGAYPIVGNYGDFGSDLSLGNKFDNLDDSSTIYMVELPTDPSKTATRKYAYETDAQGTYFILYTKLENENDSDIKIGGYTGTDCGVTDLCDFAIGSSNASL